MALNPRNTSALAFMGVLISHGGEWDRGVGIMRRSMELNPHHPGWYHFPQFFDHYRKREFDQALATTKRMNMPEDFWTHAVTAAACGRLGRREEARAALEALRSLLPGYREELGPTLGLWILDAAVVEQVMEGLAMAEALVAERPHATPAASTDSGATRIQALAVLPFADMSQAKDQEYLCEGMAEEILNALTRLPGLRVIARTSAFRFRAEQDLRKVGEALGVDVVLQGSVRRADQRLRITAQLVDVADDSHIWSERFDREMTDVFEIQDEIADAIVKKLHVSLGTSEPLRRPTQNVAAYEALVEARHFFFKFTPAAAERALVCLRRALSIDPDYPDALVLHAFYHLMMGYMFANPLEVLPQVKSLAERALALDAHHGEAQSAVAIAAMWTDWDWLACERHHRRALELAPASARAHELYGLSSLLATGRLEEALAELDRAVELDPLSALYAGNRGRVLTCLRRFAEAEEACRRGLALDPGQLLVQVELIYALTFQGRFEEAVAMGRKAIADNGLVKAPLNALALALALAGERDEAWRLLDAAREAGSAAYRSPLTQGLVHAVCSEMDDAIECVKRAVDERDPLLFYLKVHPMFDALRADPRYPELLRRVNLDGAGQA
jgi:TolB-like protein/Tfp pilus assembly protein PilF